MITIASGTAYSIGHLISASLANNGPGPGFFAPWIFEYMVAGLQTALEELPKELSSTIECYPFFRDVCFFLFL